MLNIFSKFLVLLSILGVVIFPTDVIASGKNAVELAFYQVIPSLFPFFVLQSMVVLMGISNALSNTLGIVFKKIFKISNSSPYILGIIGGYPMGFKSVIELYQKGEIKKDEAERMVGFCNNAGPAFVIGFVGVFLFSSKNIGYILLLGHILASIIVGICFRAKEHAKFPITTKLEPLPLYEIFIKSVNSGFASVLTVCGYVIFFSVFAQILMNFNVFSTLSTIFYPFYSIFHLTAQDFTAILIGMLEMTSGINYLQTLNSSFEIKIIIASFLLAFSGVSIHFQTLSFNTNLNLSKYYKAKLLQSFIAPIISFILYKVLFSNTQTVFLSENAIFYNFHNINLIFLALLFVLIIYKKLCK